MMHAVLCMYGFLKIVHREIFAPNLFLPLLPSSAGKLKTGQILMSEIILISLNTTTSVWIQDGAKMFASEEGRK